MWKSKIWACEQLHLGTLLHSFFFQTLLLKEVGMSYWIHILKRVNKEVRENKTWTQQMPLKFKLYGTSYQQNKLSVIGLCFVAIFTALINVAWKTWPLPVVKLSSFADVKCLSCNTTAHYTLANLVTVLNHWENSIKVLESWEFQIPMNKTL